MKYIAVVLALCLLSACTSNTQYGPCIGLFDEKNPKLEYKVSARNLAVGIIFFTLVFPPVFVIVDETFCPVGNK